MGNMAWIELHEAVRDFWKVQRLADLFGVRYSEAEGWVVNLWLWAISNARNGNLSKFNDMEIARGARCEVLPEKFVEKMMEVGLITHKKNINDWQKYGISKLEKHRVKMQTLRRKTVPSQLRHRAVTVPSTLPTLPNLPNHTNKQITASPNISPEKQVSNNPVHRLVRAWKRLLEIPAEDKTWDKAHFARCSKAGKDLIEIMGGPEQLELAADCMADVYYELTKAGLDCTLETVVKRAHEWRKENGAVASQ